MADRIEDYAVNSARWLSLEDFDGEVWKDIPGYEGWYQVSNMGRIKSLKNNHWRILKFSKWTNYYRVKLCTNSITKDFSVHRLVAEAFLQNSYNYPEVDHINGIKVDNRSCNLRWVTHKGNSYNKNTVEKYANAIEMLTKDGVLIATFPSVRMTINATGISKYALRNILNGFEMKHKSKWSNYIFRYQKGIENRINTNQQVKVY